MPTGPDEENALPLDLSETAFLRAGISRDVQVNRLREFASSLAAQSSNIQSQFAFWERTEAGALDGRGFEKIDYQFVETALPLLKEVATLIKSGRYVGTAPDIGKAERVLALIESEVVRIKGGANGECLSEDIFVQQFLSRFATDGLRALRPPEEMRNVAQGFSLGAELIMSLCQRLEPEPRPIVDLSQSVMIAGAAGFDTAVLSMRGSNLAFCNSVVDHGVTFNFTDFFKLDDDRFATLAIVSKPKDRAVSTARKLFGFRPKQQTLEKRLCLFYLSTSHTLFRLLPALNFDAAVLPRYDKAGREVILAPRAIVQAAFATKLRSALLSGRMSAVSHADLVRGVTRENRGLSEYGRYYDDPVSNPRLSVKLSECILSPSRALSAGEWPVPDSLSIADQTLRPNFAKPILQFEVSNPHLGVIKSFVYRSFDNQLEFIYLQTNDGEVAPASVSYTQVGTNSFGLPDKVPDCGRYCVGLLEYTRRFPVEYQGSFIGKSYVRTNKYASKIPDVVRWNRENEK